MIEPSAAASQFPRFTSDRIRSISESLIACSNFEVFGNSQRACARPGVRSPARGFSACPELSMSHGSWEGRTDYSAAVQTRTSASDSVERAAPRSARERRSLTFSSRAAAHSSGAGSARRAGDLAQASVRDGAGARRRRGLSMGVDVFALKSHSIQPSSRL